MPISHGEELCLPPSCPCIDKLGVPYLTPWIRNNTHSTSLWVLLIFNLLGGLILRLFLLRLPEDLSSGDMQKVDGSALLLAMEEFGATDVTSVNGDGVRGLCATEPGDEGHFGLREGHSAEHFDVFLGARHVIEADTVAVVADRIVGVEDISEIALVHALVDFVPLPANLRRADKHLRKEPLH